MALLLSSYNVDAFTVVRSGSSSSAVALNQHIGSGGMADTRNPDTIQHEDPRKSISAAPSFEEYLKQRANEGKTAATAPTAPPAPIAEGDFDATAAISAMETSAATTSVGYGSASSYLDTLSRTDAIAANMLDSSRKASTAASAPAKTDNFKSSPRWRKKTKQLATLGPASSDFEMIEKLFLAGADVFRLNFSHGEHAQKKELLDIIRAVEAKYDHPIAILGDLQGPKIRTGTFANPAGELLQAGQIFRFDSDETPGNAQRVFLPHPEILEASEVGHVLLIDDGKVKVVVSGKGPGYLDCEVVVGGMIKDRKGVNTPDSILEISCLTPKDREDLDYMLGIGVDWVALSFVQRPEDIVEIKRLIMSYNPNNAVSTMCEIC